MLVLSVALLVASPLHSTAATTASLPEGTVGVAQLVRDGRAVIGTSTAHFEDVQGKLTFDEVRSQTLAAQFRTVKEAQPNFGYSSSAHWLRFTLDAGASPAKLLLEVALPSLDSVQLFSPSGAGFERQTAGDLMPWHARLVKHRNHVFALPLAESGNVAGTGAAAPAPAGSTARTFYLRVQSQSVVTVPMTLWTPEAFAEHERQAQFVYGLFYGLLAAMFVYNIALLLALRDMTFLFYVAYVGALGMALLTFDGFGFEYLWPNGVWWANHALATAFSLAMAFAGLFSRRFLETRTNAPLFDSLWLGLSTVGFALAFCAATGTILEYGEIMRFLSILGAVSAATSLVVGSRLVLRGYRPARFFLLAWSTLLVFIVLAALRNFALLPTNFITLYGLHIGFTFDVLLLSFALGDRINLMRRDKLAAQTALLHAALEHERQLESRVSTRTTELDDVNRKLRVEAFEREALLQKLSESETRMRHLAQHDALTGLPNRLSLQERFSLATQYAKRNKHKVAVMLVDLDRFKELNDSRGHAAGDEALISLAGRLRTTVRGSDTVARLGGDEFVVLAADLDQRDAVRPVIDKIGDIIGIPISAGGGAWTLSASIGVAFFPDDGTRLEDLLKLADAAMYTDKVERKRRGVHMPEGTS